MNEPRAAERAPRAEEPGEDGPAEILGPGRMEVFDGRVVAHPETDGEVAALMRLAGRRGWRVLPSARGGTFDAPPSTDVVPEDVVPEPGRWGPDLMITSRGMEKLLEHVPGDLVVRARAGLEIAKLQAHVAQAGQWLALDPPGRPNLTVGEMLASGAAGPLRAVYGRPRDQILGMTLVDGGGRTLRLGGRVVKNVAGFDLVRFATGSRGALGMITEAVFRLYPVPPADRTLMWECRGAKAGWALGRGLATLPVPMVSAELVGGRWPEAPWESRKGPDNITNILILIRLQGSTAAVQRMTGRLVDLAGAPTRMLEGADSTAVSAAIAAGLGEIVPKARVHALPSAGARIATALGRDDLPVDRWALHLLEGTFRITLFHPPRPEEWGALRQVARSVGGSAVLAGMIGGAEGTQSAVGPGDARHESTSWQLRRRLLEAFDPNGILPGAWRDGWTEGNPSRRGVR